MLKKQKVMAAFLAALFSVTAIRGTGAVYADESDMLNNQNKETVEDNVAAENLGNNSAENSILAEAEENKESDEETENITQMESYVNDRVWGTNENLSWTSNTCVIDGVTFVKSSDTKAYIKSCDTSKLGTLQIPVEIKVGGSYYGINVIGENAFKNCTRIINIKIPNTMRTIGASAFNGCNSLVSVEISDTVNTIANNAFSNCPSLENINVNVKRFYEYRIHNSLQ